MKTPIFKSKSFLHTRSILSLNPPVKSNFWGMDTEEQFVKNLTALPEDWPYRTKTVEYTMNSLGYRAPEFDQVDWKNSVVMFGCSATFGEGVDDSDTIPAQLSKIIGRPVINMGAGGTSQQWSLHNSVILKEYYATPLAVIQFWTSPYRTTTYTRYSVENQGPWNNNSIYENWVHKGNAETQGYFTRMLGKNIWDNNTIYYDFAWDEEMCNVSGCDKLPKEGWLWDGNYKNLARDLCHQGPDALRCIAEFIANKLRERGVSY
jgi:hypothetical protein